MALKFNIENFVEGGGFCPEGEYRIDGATFLRWDNEGKMDPRVYLELTLQPGSGGAKFKAEGEVITQKYGVGKTDFYVPSKDGKKESESGPFVIAAPGDKGKSSFYTSSNFFLLVKSLIDNGLELDDDFSAINGAIVYMFHIDQPERAGIASLNGDEAPKGQKKTLPVVKKLLAAPGESKAPASNKSKGAAKPAAKDEEPAEQSGDDEASTPLATALKALLKKNPAGLQRSKARAELFKLVKGQSDSKEINTAFGDDDQLQEALLEIEYQLDGSDIKPV